MTALWICSGVIAILAIWAVTIYNRLVKLRNNRENAFADIDVQLKQRHDLVPQLVATVKGYAEHESETLESVIAARSAATRITVDPEKLSSAEIEEYQAAQGELGAALGRLLMITENYPDLKANQNFADLQAQLEGTENRIATERMKYNDAARAYNTAVRSFPKNIIASIFNFETKGYFSAKEGADTAPVVEF